MAYDNTSTSRRMITAMFDSRQDAAEAIERLVQAGIPRSDITTVPSEGGSATSGTTMGSSSSQSYDRNEGTGFWDSLRDLFLPDEDRHTYAEGLRRGGYLVTVRTTDALYDRAVDILDDEGTVDLDERSSSWRQEGWTDYTASGTAAQGAASSSHLGYGATSPAGLDASTGSATAGSSAGLSRSSATGVTAGAGAFTGTERSTASERGESIPIVEEQLRVGKRETSGGRVRVRSYVVETPVQEQVSLRQEHVEVERRSVDRPITDADRLFQERTIEMEEKSEQAVVSKEARVKEELVIHKDVDQRTQTVSDTVRRTEVDVEDERTRAGTGTTGIDRKDR